MDITHADIHRFLGAIQPFRSLPPGELKDLISKVQPKKFSKEETVFNEGDDADSVWVIYCGRVQVFKYTTDGRPFAIESLGSGELFGTLCRMGGNNRSYPCTAVAAEDTVTIRISDRIFLEYYSKSPGMLRGLCSLCSDRLKDVQDMRCMGQETVEVRLANILTRLHQVHGAVLPFTKKEISELIGVALETTFRALADLQKKGYLKSGRGEIEINKPDEIRKLIDRP